MLRLQRVDLSGFKSFVDPSKLDFSGGVTCIVGPNGCGKSNISDAITWVLGEQSAKSLRGSRMEDVIFSGSEKRKPLGMAEVVMTLETDPSFAAAEEGKITLSRRVFRSGESQYRLNGKLVRLKDIKDLLMDTGLGIRAYSVIEQGKIGMILSGKPQERRKLLEEAAGVTRYKARKRVAEVKLEEATANLLRLDDIISEVERSLRSLKRQANAARRYQEREAEYRELLERVLTGRWGRLSQRLAAVAGDIERAGAEEAGLAATLHRDEAALAAGRETLEQLAQVVADKHEAQSSLAARIEGRQEFLKVSRRNLAEIGERIAASRKLADERGAEIGRHRESLEALGRRRGELVAELEAAESEAGARQAELAGAEARLAQAGALVEERRSQLLAAVGQINGLKNRLHQQQIEVEKGNFQRDHLSEELERFGHEVAQGEEQVALAREAVEGLERRLAEREAELAGVQEALEGILRQEAAASEERRRLEGELARARQRHQLLTELNRAHAEGRAALEEALAEAGIAEPTYLTSRISAAQGWEQSLDFYLGALADAVVVAGGQPPLEVARALAGGPAGASLLTPLELPEEAWPQIDDPAVGLSLGEALGLPGEVAAALPPAYLVDDAAAAQRLARRHPGVAFISPQQVWAQGGLLHVEGGEVRPGVLARESELAELDAEIPSLEEALEAAVARVEELVEQRARRAQEAHGIESDMARLRQEAAVAAARRQDAEARLRRLTTERDTVSDEQGEVDRQLQRLAEAREGLARDLAQAEQRHGELQEAFDAAQEQVEAAKGEKENLRAESAGRQSRLELLRERLTSHDRETSRIEGEISDGERQVRLWREEAERLERRRRELGAEIERSEEELQGFLEQRAASQDAVLEAQRQLDEHRAALRQLEGHIAETRERHDEARSRVEELRISQATLRQEAEHLASVFRERFDREPDPEAPAPPADLAEMEADLARRKEVLDRMGPVNALAVQEYAEQEERHVFLTEQRTDVAESVSRLKATIREINQASSALFRETFAEVNASFGEIFTHLFRGGEAEMRLLDEEDLLESGIEIVARPPGKRMQNIMLMSGGEKALTAIALLFALFRSKPSPFCILDEVDAPLDDANALRFVELLKDMSGDTQFIIITHNKLTMQIAHMLYGVTMEERGVSKLVSVELDDVQPEEEAPHVATA